MKSFLITVIVLLLILVSSIFADGYNYDGGLASWNVNPKCGGQISKQSVRFYLFFKKKRMKK